ncbi:hypothetical protein MYSI104531_16825 [Mycobacterium simiae]
MGDLERAVAQHPQRHHQRARHQQHDDQGDRDGGQHQDAVPDRGGAPCVGLAVHGLGHRGGGVGDDPLGDPVGSLNRTQQVWIVDERAGRVRHDRHPGHHLLLQGLAVRRARPEHLAHAEQRRRLGAGQGHHRRAQLRFGQLGAAGDQDLLHRHLTAGTDRAAQSLCLGTDLRIVHPYRGVDDVLGRQQQRRVGGHPVAQTEAVVGHLVQQRLTAVQQRADARPDVGGDVGVLQPGLQLALARVVILLRADDIAAGGARQQRDVERRHVFRERRQHVGAGSGQP